MIATKRGLPLKPAASLIGVIEVRGVLGSVLADLGTRIVGGQWPQGETVKTEADLIDELGVSRSVVREAFRILGAKGLVRSRTSDGTRVLPRSEWRLLDPDVIDWRMQAGDTEDLLRDLLKVRLILEPGVAYTATELADQPARDRIVMAWNEKLRVYNDKSLPPDERRRQFIETDLEFHRSFLSAVGSELLDQLFSIIEAALELLLDLQMRARGYTSEMIGMEESHELHASVFDAFDRGDAEKAERAMRKLINRAIADAEDGLRGSA